MCLSKRSRVCISSDRKGFKLPAIIPCVLYNGKGNWTACRSFRETLEASEQFGDYVLDFKYILFDVKRYDEEDLLRLRNLIGSVFFIDQKPGYEELLEGMRRISEKITHLDEEEQRLLWNWMKHVILRGLPTKRAEELETMMNKDLEGRDMIYAAEEAIRKEIRKSRKQGMELGLKKGIEKGIEKGKLEVVKKLLLLGMETEKIAEVTGLPEEEIKKLQ